MLSSEKQTYQRTKNGTEQVIENDADNSPNKRKHQFDYTQYKSDNFKNEPEW